MKSEDFIIIDKIGMHARPASKLAIEVKKWYSKFEIEFNGKKVNMASPINVMTLGAEYNSKVTIYVNGPDEDNAFNSIIAWMKEQKII